ncbi:MAG TPA: hypothetical protein VJR48_10140 [Ktedonobacterales bacterium]|nr:hypothetical protein [Ktedonobacterales bacterium]
MHLGLRTLAMISGLVGTGIALILDILYSLAHVVGRVTNISNDTGHFWWGLLFVIVALVGSLVGLGNTAVGALLLVIAGIAFFFVVGPWALLASPFMLLGALLFYAGRGERARAVA